MADDLPSGAIDAIRSLRGEDDARACARVMATSEPWMTLGRGEASCLGVLRDPTRETWVAERGGRLVGFIILYMHGPFAGYIQTVCVWPDCRGQGVGSAMIGWAERRIFRESPNVFMCVSSFNRDAQRLYARLGYRVVGTLDEFIVPGHSEILIRKTTGPWAGFKKT